ncbi:hypothetical protein ACFP3I_23365 [Chryseobacterium arachidis]|uniref:hypothetical protein n=1 Tax=Chryseobacterium arachidis TaxID=1416778 RepID=UPI00361EF91E
MQSVLPLCDELIVAVGDSTDGTREAIVNLQNPKIKIIDTIWDEKSTKAGKIFALQANIAFIGISSDTDWVIHIQADEVLHEKDYNLILDSIKKADNNPSIEGFLQPFLHFWGDYNNIRNSRRVHRHEIRIFKYNPNIRAYRDSQGFRKYKSISNYDNGTEKGTKLKVAYLNAPIYHYNGVRSSENMTLKINNFIYYYGESKEILEEQPKVAYNYHTIDRVTKFEGSHPAVMFKKISEYSYIFNHDKSQAIWKKKDKYLQPIEDLLKIRFGEYKNYILVKNKS